MKKLSYNFNVTLKFGADEKSVSAVTELIIDKLAAILPKINELEDIEAATLDVPGQGMSEEPVDLMNV